MNGFAREGLNSTLTGARLIIGALMLFGAAIPPVVAESRQDGVAAAKIGEPAPGFDVQSLGGVNLQLAHLKGKVVVLNFWFIACPPCRVEIPKLNQLVEEFRGSDVAFIAFAPDSEEDLREFLETTSFEYHIIPNSTPVAERYGVTGAPTNILIDRDGVISSIRLGEVSDPKVELSRSIQKLL
jgi:peroxiredoxin